MGWKTAGILTVTVLVGGLSCSESPSEPLILGGAGLRFEFQAGAENLTGVRLELWNDNTELPPSCLGLLAGDGVYGLAEDPPPDSCSRQAVQIRDLIGETVLSLDDEPAVDGSLSYAWDGRDSDGNLVPSGYYPISSRCLDSRGVFTFEGHYFVWRSRETGACEWPLWIKEVDLAANGRALSFTAFPLIAQTVILNNEGRQQTLVTFQNPYLIRVHADGMEVFEREVTLEQGLFTTVSVRFTPVTP